MSSEKRKTEVEDLLLPSESQKKIIARFKDHRKSYGLEFIDIRKEIIAELKQIGGRKSPRASGKTTKAAQKGANLRYIGNLEKISNADHSETSILIGGKNLL